MIIDFHTHIFPPTIAERTVEILRAGAMRISGVDMRAHTDATAEGLRASMRQHGVDLSVVMPIATKPSQTQSINRYAEDISCDGILSFGSLHPSEHDPEGVLEDLRDRGFRGIKLHPEFQDFFVDSKESLRILRCAEKLGLLVLLHAGADVGIAPPVHCSPDRLRSVLDHVSGHNIVAAHLGGFDMWEQVERQLVGTPIYMDTAVVMDFLEPQWARRLMIAHGTDKILLGSDSPWAGQGRALSYICQMGFEPHVEQAILGGNARRLLKL